MTCRHLACLQLCVFAASGVLVHPALFAAEAYDTIPRDLVHPVEIGGCIVDEPRDMPSAALPQIANLDLVYEVVPADWGIHADDTHPLETTHGLNAALDWAHAQGYGTVRLPAGTYRVGEHINAAYQGGVVLPGNIRFELDPAATIRMAPNDKGYYCTVAIPSGHDVWITGGTIRGDRDSHDYSGGGSHENGDLICVGSAGGSRRILIEGMTLYEATGDGIIINDAYGDTRDVTIRDNDIHHNRRQGISIIRGSNIVIENNDIHDIKGTAPQFGIDIENTESLGPGVNRDILIRNNAFYRNKGGDFLNTDGRNVWFVDNTLDNTGLGENQVDGPIVFWHKTSQVIRGNHVISTVPNANGQWALKNYPLGTNPLEPTLVEDNLFDGGGINIFGGDHNWRMTYVRVARNIVNGHNFVQTDTPCLQFDDNQVNATMINYPFMMRDVSGWAGNNTHNGVVFPLPMTPDILFASPPWGPWP